MKVIKLSTVFLAIILTLIGSSANALVDVPTLRVGLGQSPLTFQGGDSFPAGSKLGETAVLMPMFLWDAPSLRMRIGLHFLADVGTKYGAVATAGVGLTSIFYPLGLSSSREVRDDFSEVVKTRFSPYLQVSITPTKFSVTAVPAVGTAAYANPRDWPYFSSRVVELSLGIGADYPINDNLVVFGGLHYRTATFSSGTVAVQANKDGSSPSDISYSGIALLVGVMTNFY
jgi:hypothetical protein